MTLHVDQPPLIVPGELYVTLLPEDHPQYFERRLTVRLMADGAYAVTRRTSTNSGDLVLSHTADWHIAPERLHSTRNDDYRAWLSDHRFTSLWHALNAASLVVGTITGPGGLTTDKLLAFDDIDTYPDRGRDTSDALTGVRAVLSRSETERDACHNYPSYTSDPEAETMRDALAFVALLLGRWRRVGRTAKAKAAAR